MPATQQLVLRTATERLFSCSYFSICQLDRLMEMVGTTAHSAAYTQLHALHCVHWKDMPTDLRQRIPHLVRECLSGPTTQASADIALSRGSTVH